MPARAAHLIALKRCSNAYYVAVGDSNVAKTGKRDRFLEFFSCDGCNVRRVSTGARVGAWRNEVDGKGGEIAN